MVATIIVSKEMAIHHTRAEVMYGIMMVYCTIVANISVEIA